MPQPSNRNANLMTDERITMSSIIDTAQVQVDKATENLNDIKGYLDLAKEAAKEATKFQKAVEGTAKAYAPRVVKGVKWLNENARGWAHGFVQVADDGVRILRTPDEDDLIPLGLEPDPKIAARFKLDEDTSDEVLTALWQTAQDIHLGKKQVNAHRLLKRVRVG